MNTDVINKITIKENSILKLNNVLIRTLEECEFKDINQVIYIMKSYLKSIGSLSIGPIINFYSVANKNIGTNGYMKIMIQLKDLIVDVDELYEFKKEFKVKQCLYTRFIGKKEDIHFAYQKIDVYAFENDIEVKGDSYTILVEEDEGIVVVDIFMQYMKGGCLSESI